MNSRSSTVQSQPYAGIDLVLDLSEVWQTTRQEIEAFAGFLDVLAQVEEN